MIHTETRKTRREKGLGMGEGINVLIKEHRSGGKKKSVFTLRYTGDVKKMSSKHLDMEWEHRGRSVSVWQRRLLLTVYPCAFLYF